MPKHTCHAIACNAVCPPAYLMCRAHWYMVPEKLRADVLTTVRKRDGSSIDETWAPWWKAAHRAIAAVALREGHFTQEAHDEFIQHEDAVAEGFR